MTALIDDRTSEASVMNAEEAKRAVVAVGEGRGFVVAGDGNRYIITAARCLPFFPRCMTFSYSDERTYEALVGPLGGKLTIWADCLFADPVGDIAVLGAVVNQARTAQWSAYQQFMEEVATLEIADITASRPSRSRAMPEEAPVRLLSLDGRWFGCQARHYGGALLMSDAEEVTRGGMSGSPILREDWRAIGVVCTGTSGPHARLMRGLPGWLLRELERPNDETEPAGGA